MVSRQTPLHIAAQRGLTEAVRLLIRKGTSVNTRDENGYTALHLAAYHGHEDVVAMLIEEHADVGDIGPDDGDGYSSLHIAAQEGNCGVAKLLLDAYPACLNFQNSGGDTALHLAIRNNHVEMVQLLLSRGACSDVANEEEYTAREAALAGTNDAIRALFHGDAPSPPRTPSTAARNVSNRQSAASTPSSTARAGHHATEESPTLTADELIAKLQRELGVQQARADRAEQSQQEALRAAASMRTHIGALEEEVLLLRRQLEKH